MNNWHSFLAVAVQLQKGLQLLLQNQSAKISVNGTFGTVFSMNTNISGLQSLPGVQQGSKGPSQVVFPRPLRNVSPQPSWQGCTCHRPDLEALAHQGASDPCHSWPQWPVWPRGCAAHGPRPQDNLSQLMVTEELAASSHRVPTAVHLCGLALT